VLLGDTALTDASRDFLVPKLAAAGFDVEVRTWKYISMSY